LTFSALFETCPTPSLIVVPGFLPCPVGSSWGIFTAVDRIIDHLKLRFVAEKPPPSHVFEQVALMAAEEQAEYF